MSKYFFIGLAIFFLITISLIYVYMSVDKDNRLDLGDSFCEKGNMKYSTVPYRISGDSFGSCIGFDENNVKVICSIGIYDNKKLYFYDNCEFYKNKVVE